MKSRQSLDKPNPAIQEIKDAMKKTKDKRMYERYKLGLNSR
ncbi:hypothetical protein [Salicibibacter kimchii]|nr:hypothetical protein [Salicibibacter kimchii]